MVVSEVNCVLVSVGRLANCSMMLLMAVVAGTEALARSCNAVVTMPSFALSAPADMVAVLTESKMLAMLANMAPITLRLSATEGPSPRESK